MVSTLKRFVRRWLARCLGIEDPDKIAGDVMRAILQGLRPGTAGIQIELPELHEIITATCYVAQGRLDEGHRRLDELRTVPRENRHQLWDLSEYREPTPSRN